MIALTVFPSRIAFAGGSKLARPFPKYTVEVINGMWCGVLGYEPISGQSVTSGGTVGGELRHCNGTHRAFLHPPGGPLFTMPMPAGFSSAYGADVNDLKWLVGRINQTGVGYLGFVYKPDGSLALIPPPPEGNWCEATGVNNAGITVGWWANVTTGPDRMAYRWENGIRTDLAMLRGPKSEARGISESGLITGWTGNSSLLDACAFILWEDGSVTELPPVAGGTSSIGYSINDHGDICGQGWVPEGDFGKWRAFAYIDGELIAIPPLPGYTDHTGASGINVHRQVVGGSGAGFIWQDGVLAKLGDLLADPPPALYISGAQAITDDGQIVAGCGFTTSGEALTCLLTPVPGEPADLDGNGLVDTVDVTILLGAWGRCQQVCPADLDGNEVVNGFDLAMLLASWGPL